MDIVTDRRYFSGSTNVAVKFTPIPDNHMDLDLERSSLTTNRVFVR